MHRTHTTSTSSRKVPRGGRQRGDCAPRDGQTPHDGCGPRDGRAARSDCALFNGCAAHNDGRTPHDDGRALHDDRVFHHAERRSTQAAFKQVKTHRAERSTGSVTRMRTPRRRSEDQRVNLRRSYQALIRKLRTGDASATSTYQSWPVRPYAASI